MRMFVCCVIPLKWRRRCRLFFYWIPAFAGMTEGGGRNDGRGDDGRGGGNDGRGDDGREEAGMTEGGHWSDGELVLKRQA